MPMVRGLERYVFRELTPAARAALDALRAAGWKTGRVVRCTCGKTHSGEASILCYRCRDGCQHLGIRGYIIKIDGYGAPHIRCGWCGSALNEKVTEKWIYDVLFQDSREGQTVPPCARCGDTEGTQLHHWAPGAVFEDSNAWPTSHLCQRCHSIWHDAMRRALGVSLPEGGRAFAVADSTPFVRKLANVEPALWFGETATACACMTWQSCERCAD